ncbi:GerMN domain-containing protein [Streptomyces sp. AC512_CC834]|uniref:GerMN domain-containing protein n=1 Tax=Streptomyces sp. AC512_CC834 TaxID=2823691 RepID=UPI001C272D38|nr:hypothetical protein [Streptomyces sp. AC512_CC834]
MAHRPAPRTRRAAVGALAAPLLVATVAGCGIGATGPVHAGAPASGVQRPGSEARTARLYFAGPYGVQSVTRSVDRPPSPQQALELLLEGPTPAERERGLTTQVPPMGGLLTATASDGAVDVFVPVEVSTGELDVTAVSQLACTAAHADVPGDRPATRVDIRIHENLTRSRTPWTVRCGPGGTVTPVTG